MKGYLLAIAAFLAVGAVPAAGAKKKPAKKAPTKGSGINKALDNAEKTLEGMKAGIQEITNRLSAAVEHFESKEKVLEKLQAAKGKMTEAQKEKTLHVVSLAKELKEIFVSIIGEEKMSELKEKLKERAAGMQKNAPKGKAAPKKKGAKTPPGSPGKKAPPKKGKAAPKEPLKPRGAAPVSEEEGEEEAEGEAEF